MDGVRTRTDAKTTYAIDDRRLFCRHCGQAAWRHRRQGRDLLCAHLVEQETTDAR